MSRHEIIAAYQDAMAADDELAADIEDDVDALWDFPPEGEDVFGKASKIDRLRKRLDKLKRRLEKVQNKPEPSGLFARLRANLREKRIARLEKRIDKITDKLEAAGGGEDELAGWPPAGGYVPPGAHASIPRYQTIGSSAAMSTAALVAALSNPAVSQRSKARIRQVLAQRGMGVPVGLRNARMYRDQRDRMLFRMPHRRIRASRVVSPRGYRRRWR